MVIFAKSWIAASPTDHEFKSSSTLGILSLEVAATMARLVSLHRSLSETEMSKLRSETMRSQGVAYLNSKDQVFLLRLACAEFMEEFDSIANTITRLGLRCKGTKFLTHDFARVYTDLKGGISPVELSKFEHPKVKKMEKLIAITAKLSAEMEMLEELEVSERKLEKRWGRLSGPIPLQQQIPIDPDSLHIEIKSQSHLVRKLKEESLWSQSVDKAVSLMGRSVCANFLRICTIFGPFLSSLPLLVDSKDRTRPLLRFRAMFSSGPIIERREIHTKLPISSSCPIIGLSNKKRDSNWKKILEAPPNTVGGSGLALRYANVIIYAERLLQLEAEGREDEVATEREEMYEMLPIALKSIVRSKLREWWRNRGPLDQSLAEGWKEAVTRILTWLGPVARDTLRWHNERSMDRKRRFETRPRALILQTLHVSNREKVEASIAEVLVGLSCLCWYEERQRGSFRV